MRSVGILACAWLGLTTTALAGECPDQSQQGLNRCADAAYKKADAELNAAYRDIARRLKDDPETTKLLVAAQKAWIAFRDAECGFAASENAGGSIYPMVYSGCLERLTRKRAAELRGYQKCEEGNLGCPVPKE